MTLAKWKMLSAVAVAVALTSGVGLYAARADEKKTPPAEAQKKTPPAEGQKVKPGDDPTKPKPDGDKPKAQPTVKVGGEVGGVDVAAKTITVVMKGDKGRADKVVKLSDDAKVTVDGAEASLAAVKKGAFASFIGATGKDGQPITATEVRVTGGMVNGLVSAVDASTVTLDVGGKESKETKVLKLAANGRVQVGKTAEAKLTDLKVGDKVSAVLTTDGTAALNIQAGRPDKEGEKKPEKKKPEDQ